ncbi:hypothetical protein BJV82DRAFT_631677 [Fennellomyces sp. T-0311]|nr:hypothetical protein BJV82DRAFT_631677 [Fennellomyces sp. T-0311]
MTNTNAPEIFVDVIANLPSELVTQILLHLIGSEHDWSSIWSCLMVSRTWQMRIFNSSIWRVVRLDHDAHDIAVVSFAIPAFMDKVQELGLASIPLDILFRCLSCLDAGGFSSLKSLSLEGLLKG